MITLRVLMRAFLTMNRNASGVIGNRVVGRLIDVPWWRNLFPPSCLCHRR